MYDKERDNLLVSGLYTFYKWAVSIGGAKIVTYVKLLSKICFAKCYLETLHMY